LKWQLLRRGTAPRQESVGVKMEDARAARQALTEAINRCDLPAIKTLVHPSYQATSDLGVTLDYQAMMGAAEQLLRLPHFQETVEIEAAEVEGDSAKLVTTRTESFTGFLWLKQHVTTHQVETWQRFDGEWLLVTERLLSS